MSWYGQRATFQPKNGLIGCVVPTDINGALAIRRVLNSHDAITSKIASFAPKSHIVVAFLTGKLLQSLCGCPISENFFFDALTWTNQKPASQPPAIFEKAFMFSKCHCFV